MQSNSSLRTWRVQVLIMISINVWAMISIFLEEGIWSPFIIAASLIIVIIMDVWLVIKNPLISSTRLHKAMLFALFSTGIGVILTLFSSFYYTYGICNSGTHEIIKSKLLSLYFSVVTFTTLGYGDFYPANNVTRTCAATEAVVGYVLFGILVASIVALARDSDTTSVSSEETPK